MTDNQSSKTEKRPANLRKIALLGVGTTVLAIINMSTGIEAHSHAVRILEYTAPVGGLIALVGGLIIMVNQRA